MKLSHKLNQQLAMPDFDKIETKAQLKAYKRQSARNMMISRKHGGAGKATMTFYRSPLAIDPAKPVILVQQ